MPHQTTLTKAVCTVQPSYISHSGMLKPDEMVFHYDVDPIKRKFTKWKKKDQCGNRRPHDVRLNAKHFRRCPSSWMDNMYKNSPNVNICYAQAPQKPLPPFGCARIYVVCVCGGVKSYGKNTTRTIFSTFHYLEHRGVHYLIIWFSIHL